MAMGRFLCIAKGLAPRRDTYVVVFDHLSVATNFGGYSASRDLVEFVGPA
jgi:hypothetical protein